MKKTIYLLISLLFISCNTSRKVKSEKEENKDRSSINEKSLYETKSSNETRSESGTASVTDSNKFWSQNNLKVKSKGSAFQLSYNGVTFSGDADVEFSNNQEQTNYYNVFSNYYIYHHINVYHNINVTAKKNITYKYYKNNKKNTEAEKDNFWLGVLIFCGGMITMAAILYLWKKYNPIQIIKKWIK